MKAPDGMPYEVYLSGAEGPPKPAIMMFSPIFGVDSGIRSLADRWAGRGYVVAAPDYFARVEPGTFDRGEEGRKRAFVRWDKLVVDRAITDLRSLMDHLLGLPSSNGKVAALGYCAGGEMAFLCGTRLGVPSIATFHASRIGRHLDEADRIDRATLHFGGSDKLVPMDEVEAIRGSLKSNPNVDIHVYLGVDHGFSFEGQPRYDEHAAVASDRRAQEVFAGLKR